MSYKYGYNSRVIEERDSMVEILHEQQVKKAELNKRLQANIRFTLQKDAKAVRIQYGLEKSLKKALSSYAKQKAINDETNEALFEMDNSSRVDCGIDDRTFKLLIQAQVAANNN